MLIPYNVDVPQERWPIANWVLIGITVVISTAAILSGEPTEWDLLRGNLPWHYAWALHRDGFSIPQLVGALFIHVGVIHLLGNMVFLFCFGNAANAKLGHVLYVSAYLLLGVLSALAWLAIGNGRFAVGASGAIMGIVGIYLVYFPRNDVRVLYCFWFFYIVRAGVFSLSSYWLILLYMAFDVWGLATQNEGVAYVAHVAGAFGGVGVATVLLATNVVASTDTEENLFQVLRVWK
jgi:membrane associated rhomboid family serine protease